MCIPAVLAEKRKRRLSTLLVAVGLDWVCVIGLYSITKATCPIPLHWLQHLAMFVGLAFCDRLNPYITNKRTLNPVSLRTTFA
jgi:hypothetical protein